MSGQISLGGKSGSAGSGVTIYDIKHWASSGQSLFKLPVKLALPAFRLAVGAVAILGPHSFAKGHQVSGKSVLFFSGKVKTYFQKKDQFFQVAVL